MRTLDVLPAEERKLLLETWNETEAAYPSERCIHELFEEQVRRTPDAIAVVQDDVELTYAELNRRANRLAHRLDRGLGVGPDALVGLCVERDPRDGGRPIGDPEGGRSVRAAGAELSDGATAGAGARCRAGAGRSWMRRDAQALGGELGDETRLVALDDDGDDGDGSWRTIRE